MCSRLLAYLFVSNAFGYYNEETPFWKYQRQREEQIAELNLNDTYFLSLKNYQVDAKSASEIDYPWIARVVHSRTYMKPQICTAICIDKQIFITAARCIISLKLIYTSVIYHDQRLKPKAFVTPSVETKQMYDDIGFIIVHDEFDGNWKTVRLLDQKRTDKSYKWFANITFEDFEHRVIGYAKFKTDESSTAWKRPYYLTQLDVNVGINLCREILAYNQLFDAFAVPCYHSCTLSQFEGKEGKTRHPRCAKYHGSEGSAIINLKTSKLLGVATWGSYFGNFEMPVGFAIPNSKNFFEDRICAEKIRNDEDYFVAKGYYQKLCDTNRKSNYLFKENDNKYGERERNLS